MSKTISMDEFEHMFGFRPNAVGQVCRGYRCDPRWGIQFKRLWVGGEEPDIVLEEGVVPRPMKMKKHGIKCIEMVRPIDGAYQVTVNMVYAKF